MDYKKARDKATLKLKLNGLKYTVTRAPSISLINGQEVRTEKQTFEIYAIRQSIDARKMKMPTELGESLIQAGDVRLMASADHEVKVGDTLYFDDTEWRVVAPNPFKPAGIVIYYELQLRS